MNSILDSFIMLFFPVFCFVLKGNKKAKKFIIFLFVAFVILLIDYVYRYVPTLFNGFLEPQKDFIDQIIFMIKTLLNIFSAAFIPAICFVFFLKYFRSIKKLEQPIE